MGPRMGAGAGQAAGFPTPPAPLEPGISAPELRECCSAAAMHNSGAEINWDVLAHFQTLNLDSGEST